MSISDQPPTFTVATWNVERPKPRGWKIPPAQRERMAEVDADVWVLTETHRSHAPSDEHIHSIYSPADLGRLKEHECSAAIWSRWPIEPITDPEPHKRGTVAGSVDTPLGPVVVYATIIPWANDPKFEDGSPAKMWQAHRAGIERQGGEWKRLRELHPGVPLVVAGDFNQDRDGSGWYGTKDARAELGAALAATDLTCLTEADAVAIGQLKSDHLIDHICATSDLVSQGGMRCWEKVDQQGRRLSDHPTVAITLAVTQ